MNSDLKGMRCILVVRCSSKDQVDVSIEKQIEIGQQFASENGMEIVATKEFPGFSASLGLHYEGLYKLIERKKENNDFDSLLFMSYDRFCRGGTTEGNRIVDDFTDAGISLVSIREGLITGELAWLQQGMIFHQASKYVQDLSFHMTVGWEHSLEAKRIPHSGHSPYGIDKLFLDSKGNALYIVRDLPDRSRVKLDPKSQTEIEIFPKGMAGPIRQPTERIVLVPGDPLRVEVVRSIFRRHFVDGWKEYRIAKELNDRGTPSKFRVHPVEA